MGKDKIKVEGAKAVAEVVAYLEDLTAGMRAGSVCMTVGQDCMTLKPRGVMEFSLKVSQKKDKEKLSLEVEWTRAEDVSLKVGGAEA
ncbi:amphi-Trp domain-containing protein [Fundidesulfovibrio soli]|uniref:amphi-Trp domain-containing protein n=1 Tax=Fundidesulfovibrio soli TaxID=2922716 RepID=UPI001FAE88D5|nr:amphi-Trp domain-containing protein [Fundidesulfovibrio soli]